MRHRGTSYGASLLAGHLPASVRCQCFYSRTARAIVRISESYLLLVGKRIRLTICLCSRLSMKRVKLKLTLRCNSGSARFCASRTCSLGVRRAQGHPQCEYFICISREPSRKGRRRSFCDVKVQPYRRKLLKFGFLELPAASFSRLNPTTSGVASSTWNNPGTATTRTSKPTISTSLSPSSTNHEAGLCWRFSLLQG
jgi:hypothetical protein